MSKNYSIVVADDHEIVRHGVKFTLQNHFDMDVIFEASSYSDLLTVLEKTPNIDLLILDLNLGDNNGVNSIYKLVTKYPSLKILVLSMYPEDPYALQSIKAGAKGYVSKASISDELIVSVESIINGGMYINEKLLEDMPLDFKLEEQIPTNPLEILSSRELEVLKLVGQGLTYKEIAKKLNLSPKTVSTYRTRILDKLSLENTNQLIQFISANNMGSI